MFLLETWNVLCHSSLLQQIEGRSNYFLDAFTRHIYTRNRSKFLDLVFSYFTCLSVIHDVHLLVSPDTSHPTFIIKVQLRIKNQTGLLIFLSENTLVVNTYVYTTEFTPTIELLSTMRFLLAVGRLVVTVTQAVKTVVSAAYIKFCNFVYDFLRIKNIL
jgi:hypothetical protein